MDERLRILVDLYDRTIQKNRIAFGNRAAAIKRGDDQANADQLATIERWALRFTELEKDVLADIRELSKDMPIIDELVQLKGISFLLASKITCMIDIQRADTVSSLWRYAGYGVAEDGKRDRPIDGVKLVYNKRLKTTCYIVASQFLKANSPYRKVYDDAREFYGLNRLEWTKGHCHLASMRKMTKVWLSHLWERWRTIEGLPVRDLYVMEKEGHTSYLRADEFGWRPL
jgi:hypothetical protein